MIDNSCPYYIDVSETMLHSFFSCNHATQVWDFFNLTHVAPLSSNRSDIAKWTRDAIHSNGIIVAVILWTIWLARNKLIFDNERSSPQLIVYRASCLLNDIDKAYQEINSPLATTRMPREVAWMGTSSDQRVVLNVDGSAIQHPGHSGFGGLLRDHTGTFLFGFYGSADQSSILRAEVLGVMHGLRLCWEHGYRDVICYSDSLNAVKFINEGVSHCHPLANEISIIKKHMQQDWARLGLPPSAYFA